MSASALQVLKLGNHFNISDILTYPKRFEIDAQLQELVNSVKVPKVALEVEDAIRKLSQSQLKDFDIDRFVDNVSCQRSQTPKSAVLRFVRVFFSAKRDHHPPRSE